MTHCLFMQGVQALTTELTVRFISPVCTGDKLMVCARLLGQRGIYLLEAWLTKGQQTVARATAKFIVPLEVICFVCDGTWHTR
jgi:acyl-coenzyme A thioesterase PaaI-like protein